jgi:predicted AlkP superfamily phosphohydrolase/phosphomutase
MFRKNNTHRVFVIGLDGFPHSLVTSLVARGHMPFLGSLFESSKPIAMRSVMPTLSSVAWATYMTGKNPGYHRIFGFLDRRYNPYQQFIPNSSHMGCQTIWNRLGNSGRKTLVVNVPMTYPPERVNGILVGGFLGVDIDKLAYPASIAQTLRQSGYIIDADTTLGLSGQWNLFIDHLKTTIDRRIHVFSELLDREEWHFCQLHIMETDRLFHYLWSAVESPETSEAGERVLEFFDHLDHQLRNLFKRLTPKDDVIILSDHGFCRTEGTIQLNRFLQEQGFLEIPSDKGSENPPSGTLYSMLPGRIYLNRKNIDPNGKALQQDEAEILMRITTLLKQLTCPKTGASVIKSVFHRDQIYSGPYLQEAPDLIAIPEDGFELRSNYRATSVFGKSNLQGTHTYDNAFVWSKHHKIVINQPEIIDLFPSILHLFGLEDQHSEGNNLFL